MVRLSSGDYDGTNWFCDGWNWVCRFCRDAMECGDRLPRASKVVGAFQISEHRDQWPDDMTSDDIDACELIIEKAEHAVRLILATVPPGQSHDDENFKP